MAQEFDVRLLDIGQERVPVLAIVRPLIGLPADACRRFVDAGGPVVFQNLSYSAATRLAAQLRNLGATVDITACSSSPDHLSPK